MYRTANVLNKTVQLGKTSSQFSGLFRKSSYKRFYSTGSYNLGSVTNSTFSGTSIAAITFGAIGAYFALNGSDQANAAPVQTPRESWKETIEKNNFKTPVIPPGDDKKGKDTLSTLKSLGWGVIGLGVAVGAAAFFASRYKKCPSNKILVIQGAFTGGSGAKCLHGGGDIVWPVIQQHSFLSLEPIQIEAPLRGALSLENIRINVPSVFTVGISTKSELMLNAAERLLGLERTDVAHQAKDIIFGQLRQVVASMKIEDINRDRNAFVKNVKHNIEQELEKIGLELINVNITDLTDDAGYLTAMGKKAAQEAIQKAEVDVAEQQKYGQIGVTEFRKDTILKKALLLREQTIGEAAAKFSQETDIKAQERSMRIKVATLNAEMIKGENEAKEHIAESNAKLAIREAEAFRESETRKKEAEAAVKEASARAEARAAIEVGNRIEADKRAELEAPAKALKAKILVDAEAKAEEARIIARGQAEALYAKLEAEARGQLEILKSKAEGMKQMVESSGGSQEAFQLLMLEHVDKLAEISSKAISNIKFDKIVVWDGGNSKGSGNETGNAASTFLRGLASALPPTMHMMRDVAGVEMPTYFGKILDERKTDLSDKKEKMTRLMESLNTERDQEKIKEIKDEMEKLEREIRTSLDVLSQRLD